MRFSFFQAGGREEDSLPPPFYCLTYHYLIPSIPNVHAVSAQTTGMVMQVYFPDGSHLPASPRLSLAHIWDDSQHISLAAICLSVFTANQTSEQPNSLMGGGLEDFSCMAVCFVIPPPLSPYSTSSSLPISSQNFFFALFFLLNSHLWTCSFFFFLSVVSLASVSFFFLHATSFPPPFHFRSRWQGAAKYSPVPAREWAMCMSPIVAEGAAEPDVNIRCESSHL